MNVKSMLITGVVASIALGGLGFLLGQQSVQWGWEREKAGLEKEIEERTRVLHSLQDQVRKVRIANREKREKMREMWEKMRKTAATKPASTQPGQATRPGAMGTKGRRPSASAAAKVRALKPKPKPTPTPASKPATQKTP